MTRWRWLLVLLLLSAPALAQIPLKAFGEHEHNIPINGWPGVTIGSIRTNGDITAATGNVHWENLETCPAASSDYHDPCFHFSNLKAWLDLVTAHGVDILFTTNGIPCSINGTVPTGCDDTQPPTDISTGDTNFKNFVTAMMNFIKGTYGNGTLTAWGCFNEPNNNPANFWAGTQAQLGILCKDLYVAAHAVDPAILIGTPEPQGTSLDNYLDAYFTTNATLFAGVGNGIAADFIGGHFYLGRSFGICPSAWISPCAAPTINVAGSGYVTGDIVTVTQTGASGGKLKVTASGGVVTGLAVYKYGAGYATGTALSTTGGTGTGLKVNITSTVNVANAGSFDNLPETVGTLVESMKSVMLSHSVGSLQIWDTENGFGKVQFWPNVDLEAYFAATQTVVAFAHGMSRTFKYSWSGDPVGDPNNAFGYYYNKGGSPYTGHGTTCASKTPCLAATAYQAVHDWLTNNGGATFTDMCTVTSNIETCNLTLGSGAPAQIIWDTSKSCTDDGVCDTSPYTVNSQYTTVQKIDGTTANIVGNSVALGVKPMMVVALVPVSGNTWGGTGVLGGQAVIQ